MNDLILDELRAIRADVSEMKATVAAQHVTLEDHTRRSTANEESLKEVRGEVEELKRFTAKWAGAWTALGAVATLAGIAASVAKVLGAF